MKKFLFFLLFIMSTVAFAQDAPNHGMLIRISEIEVYPAYYDEYMRYAKEVAEASVTNEPDVVCIYPMTKVRNQYQVRILEIYRNMDAYQKHLASAHFKKYKQGTLHMVKSLDLVDMYQVSPQIFTQIFQR